MDGHWPAVERAVESAGIVQGASADGIEFDLGPGYPGEHILDVGAIGWAYREALLWYGGAALAYGANAGPEPFLAALRGWLAHEGQGVPPEGSLMATAGSSVTLSLLLAQISQRGNLLLVEDLTYDLALHIARDLGLIVHRVPMDAEGMNPDALRHAITRGGAEHVAAVYVQPTFHNPLGHSMSYQRRLDILSVVTEFGIPVIEDDAYADLGFTATRVASLVELADWSGVYRLGSFSKTLGPGLRTGWIAGDCAGLAGLEESGVFESGGCPNQLGAMAVARLLEAGRFRSQVEGERETLSASVRALREVLLDGLGESIEISAPCGGMFLWARVSGQQADELTAAAHASGVRVLPGFKFGRLGSDAVRLSIGRETVPNITAAAERLVAVWG